MHSIKMPLMAIIRNGLRGRACPKVEGWRRYQDGESSVLPQKVDGAIWAPTVRVVVFLLSDQLPRLSAQLPGQLRVFEPRPGLLPPSASRFDRTLSATLSASPPVGLDDPV